MYILLRNKAIIHFLRKQTRKTSLKNYSIKTLTKNKNISKCFISYNNQKKQINSCYSREPQEKLSIKSIHIYTKSHYNKGINELSDFI